MCAPSMGKKNMDKIYFRRFETTAYVGVFSHEKKAAQPICISLEFDINSKKAAASDLLSATINYDDVKSVILSVIAERHYQLLETLAEAISQSLFNHFPISCLALRVEKTTIYSDMEAVGISITRP